MPQFYVEGVFITKQAVKKARESGKIAPGSFEPYAKAIWANNAKEAIQIATEELAGGEWTDGPRVGQVTEEDRMRAQGAPELPGLFDRHPKGRRA